MFYSVAALARTRCFHHVVQGPEPFGYWNTNSPADLNLTGLLPTSTGQLAPFRLEELEEQDGHLLLRPTVADSEPLAAHQVLFYWEVLSLSDQQLQLALWARYPSEDCYCHVLIYEWNIAA